MSTPFRFKQFSIFQSRSAMKVGTDGVLLGAWCGVENAKYILDIGTGTGLIALMAAQRNPGANITAVEIDPGACRDARENFQRSPWPSSLNLIEGSIANFAAEPVYDLIVSNPPFYSNSLKSPNPARTAARHTLSLAPEMIPQWSQMLNTGGRIAVILPCEPAENLLSALKAKNLHLHRLCTVKPTPQKAPHRLLLEFGKTPVGAPELTELIIEDVGRHGYSREYRRLTSEFYLNF